MTQVKLRIGGCDMATKTYYPATPAVDPPVAVFGQLVDSTGTTWTHANITIRFVPRPGEPGPYTYNDAPVVVPPPLTTNSTGAFTVNLPKNKDIWPQGSMWEFIIDGNTSFPATKLRLSVDDTEDISTKFTNATRVVPIQPTDVPRAYSEANISGPNRDGQLYFNTTDQQLRVSSDGVWVPVEANPGIPGAGTFLQTAGGTMTGALVLSADPTFPMEAATKQYVDDEITNAIPDTSDFITNANLDTAIDNSPIIAGVRDSLDDLLPLDGSRHMTGPLILDADPTFQQEATTKRYVDNMVYGLTPGATPFLMRDGTTPMLGPLTLAGAPTQDLHAATKEYVDDVEAKLDDYLPLAGGTVTGPLVADGGLTTAQSAELRGSYVHVEATGVNIITTSDPLQLTGASPNGIKMSGTVAMNDDVYINGVLTCPNIQGSYINMQTGGTMQLTANPSMGIRLSDPTRVVGSLTVDQNITAGYVKGNAVHSDGGLTSTGYAHLEGTFVQLRSQNIELYSTGPGTDGIKLEIPYGGLWQNAKIRLNGEIYARGSMMNFEVPQGSGYFTLNAPGIYMSALPGGQINVGSNFQVSYQGTTTIQNNLTCQNLTVNGTATKPGGGSWSAPSDARLKTDVEDYTEGLETIAKLNPIKFRYNSRARQVETGKQFVGLAAEEVRKTMPQLVGSFKQKIDYEDTEESDVLTVDPSELLYTIINSLKQINKRLEKLENEHSSASV